MSPSRVTDAWDPNLCHGHAVQWVREYIEWVLEESQLAVPHELAKWTTRDGGTEIDIPTLRQGACECIPLELVAGGYIWRFSQGRWIFDTSIIVTYRSTEIEL